VADANFLVHALEWCPDYVMRHHRPKLRNNQQLLAASPPQRFPEPVAIWS
jgi:hypothetical protein